MNQEILECIMLFMIIIVIEITSNMINMIVYTMNEEEYMIKPTS